MKAIKSLLLLIFVLCANLANGQRPIVISEDSVNFGQAKYPGIHICIPEVNYDKTQKNWIRQLQSGTKSKVVVENGEMSIFGAIIKDISPNPMNIYSRLVNQDSILVLQASFELKKDNYIEKANGDAQLIAARAYLKKFSKEQYLEFVKDEVQAEDKKLKDLKNELSTLQNEKSKMQKSIQSNRTTISSEKDNIALQNTELAKLSAEIITQNNQLTSMDAGAAKEEKATYLKDLEKRKKKITNDIESSENKINKANSEINNADQDIPKNESRQDEMRGKITQKEAVVQKFTDKLNKVEAY